MYVHVYIYVYIPAQREHTAPQSMFARAAIRARAAPPRPHDAGSAPATAGAPAAPVSAPAAGAATPVAPREQPLVARRAAGEHSCRAAATPRLLQPAA